MLEQKTIKITTYADDVRDLIQAKFGATQPVVIGHSFGGSVLMKLLEKDASGVKGAGAWAGRPTHIEGQKFDRVHRVSLARLQPMSRLRRLSSFDTL